MNIFKQLSVSIYSPKAIASFRMQGIGKSILYVFLLSLLSAIPIIVNFSIAITQSIQSVSLTIDREFPPFVIKNGQLNSEENEPITTEKDGMSIYFDSSGTLTSSDLDSSEDSIAFLKDEFIITSASAGTSQEFSYSMLNNMELTKETLVELLETTDRLLPFLSIIPILLVFLFASLMKFIEVSILALMGSLVSTINGKALPYRPLWNMAVYSATISTLFFMVMDLLQTAVPGGFMLNWFVSLVILYLALKELNPEKEQAS